MTPGRSATLQNIPTNKIQRNTDNPRLIFRAEELEELADSIQDIGVQVPVSVFKDGSKYTLIDGERRWRASIMINKETLPAIIYPKPGPVKNIVYMFNIHRFRRDWDPLPTAMKLTELKDLLCQQEGTLPTEAQLAALTGMTRGAIRRCNIIMEIPQTDRDRILAELEKPEKERRITTDLFIETQRSVRTVGRYLPKLQPLETPLRQSLIEKYERNIIVNVVHMRMVAKIARAATKGVSPSVVTSVLESLVTDPQLGVEEAYAKIAWAYDLRSIQNQARSLDSLIASLPDHIAAIDEETRDMLRALASKIGDFLR